MVFGRRKVIKEIPESFQDASEVVEILRARRLIEGYAVKWRELYRRLLTDVYIDKNIPDEDKQSIVSTIVDGVVRAVERGSLLSASRVVNASLAELMKDIAAVLEGKKRVIIEKRAEELAEKGGLSEEALEQLFELLKSIGLEMYKEIQADANIGDKRENWRKGFMAFVDIVSSGSLPALEMMLTRYAHVLANAFRTVLEMGEA